MEREDGPGEGNPLMTIGQTLDEVARNNFVKTLVDTIHEGLIVIDETARIVAFSRTASSILGYREEEVLGKNVEIMMPSPYSEAHDGFVHAYLETGERKIIGIGRRVPARHKDGREIPVQLEVGETVIGGTRLFLGTIEDVSDSEEQRRKFRSLTEQLAQASRITSMGMLASAIAHELNQPLATIQNYVETIADLAREGQPVDPATLREAMDACTHETARAGEIIRRLRQFMSSGDVERSRESLAGLVGEALALAMADGESSRAQVAVGLDPSADAVLVDPVQIQQVVFNLVRNAMQAMEGRQDRRIRISSIPDGAMVEVVVEDSGPGLDDNHKEELIRPFSTSKAGGMGLGLAICRTILEGHGGRLWASDSPLGGAALHFTVPGIVSAGIEPP